MSLRQHVVVAAVLVACWIDPRCTSTTFSAAAAEDQGTAPRHDDEPAAAGVRDELPPRMTMMMRESELFRNESGRRLATTVTLNCDTLLGEVNGYYSGQGGGPNYGVIFSPGTACSASPSIPNGPSPNYAFNTLDYVTFTRGFYRIQFKYRAPSVFEVHLFTGPNRTGVQIGLIPLQASRDSWTFTILSFQAVGSSNSIRFFSLVPGLIVDDFEITLDVPPPTLPPSTTRAPTKLPTMSSPSKPPTGVPTNAPTIPPTLRPSQPPTKVPAGPPTKEPTKQPTLALSRTTVTLGCEGASGDIGSYYNGQGGPNYGITFSPGVTCVAAPPLLNGPSSNFAFIFLFTNYVTFTRGFYNIKFKYQAPSNFEVQLFTGPNRTGVQIGLIPLQASRDSWTFTILSFQAVGSSNSISFFSLVPGLIVDDFEITLDVPVSTKAPTGAPTKEPSRFPTAPPTRSPTLRPTRFPTRPPTMAPTPAPTRPPTKSPSMPPTLPPTRPPTKAPSKPPTLAPTRPPTTNPSKPPTLAPVRPPTKNPTKQPSAACTATSYWVWNPKTDKVVSQITNSSSLCFPVPYNVEARPCRLPTKYPVTMVLWNARLSNKLRTQKESSAPFFLWGDNAATGNVFASTKSLPAGTYYLDTTLNGVVERIKFTKTC